MQQYAKNPHSKSLILLKLKTLHHSRVFGTRTGVNKLIEKVKWRFKKISNIEAFLVANTTQIRRFQNRLIKLEKMNNLSLLFFYIFFHGGKVISKWVYRQLE